MGNTASTTTNLVDCPRISLDTSVNQDLIEILVKEIPLSGAHELECRRRSPIRRVLIKPRITDALCAARTN